MDKYDFESLEIKVNEYIDKSDRCVSNRIKNKRYQVVFNKKRCLGIVAFLILTFLILLALIILVRAANLRNLFRPNLNFENLTFEFPSKLLRAERLSKAITFRTISGVEEECLKFRQFIDETFPEILQSEFVHRKIVNKYSLLYRVDGTSESNLPYLLWAHFDVVPPGNTSLWEHDPFEGHIVKGSDDEDDYIFGRGTLDNKHAVMGILEAFSILVKRGIRPKRSFYVAFGHDEEIGGHNGAAYMADILSNYSFSFILDEGMFVIDGAFPSVQDPVIYIGVVQKGRLLLNITAHGQQGHSSVPPSSTAIGILSRTVANLETFKQPSRFGDGPEIDTFRYVAPHASFLYKLIFGNLWLFSGLVSKILSVDSGTDAIQRTTTAVTYFQGGFKYNVVPNSASAIVDFRLHPSDNPTIVLDRIKDDLATLDVEVLRAVKSLSVSPYGTYFELIGATAKQVFPKGHVAPGTFLANSDAFHYSNLSDAIYFFSPLHLHKKDTKLFHGINERISVHNYEQVVEFYYRIMRNMDLTDIPQWGLYA